MRAAPTPEGRVVHVPAPIRIVLRVLGRRRLGLDPRPGHRRRHLGGLGRLAVPVGLRLGRRRDAVGAASRRSGSGSTRSRPSTTCSPGRCASSAIQGWAHHRPAGRRSRVARRRRPHVLHLARARRRGRDRHADRGARRLHGAHARAHGPVRARPVARPGRDVHGLVPDAEPARGLRRRAGRDHRRGARRRPGRRGPRRASTPPPSSAGRSRAACSTPSGRSRASPSSPSAPRRSSSTACRRRSPSPRSSATRRSSRRP